MYKIIGASTTTIEIISPPETGANQFEIILASKKYSLSFVFYPQWNWREFSLKHRQRFNADAVTFRLPCFGIFLSRKRNVANAAPRDRQTPK